MLFNSLCGYYLFWMGVNFSSVFLVNFRRLRLLDCSGIVIIVYNVMGMDEFCLFLIFDDGYIDLFIYM